MFFTGFADEAAAGIDRQIEATKKLNWHFIEMRGVNGKNLATMTDAEFEEVSGKLADAGVQVNCFGSGVANWQRHPRKQEDFDASKKELLDAIPRMHKLGIKMVRGMSFLTPTDEAPDSPELEAIIFAKVRELVKICENEGIVYGHENCMNYGGLSHLHSLKLIDNVKSDAFKLIFDTGNPTFNYRRIGHAPYALQSSWEFYKNVRKHIAYVHIKDATAIPGDDMNVRPQPTFTFAGDGCGDVRAIVTDLLKTGYDGGFSMEPHVANVYHDSDNANPSPEHLQYKFDSYVRYGQLFEKLLRECGWKF